MAIEDVVINNLFKDNKQCIVNADLDGILSGMFLQKFLGWEVVGYSSCCGRVDDDLWIKEGKKNIRDYIFVDLPVCIPNVSVIDQHFVAFDNNSIQNYNNTKNKINPNVIRGRVFRDAQGNNQYTSKYPFGTVHFVLAILEKIGKINENYVFQFDKKLGEFDLADLILRADRVIGNTNQYTPNCLDWSDWIINIGGKNTKTLFSLVKNEYQKRTLIEPNVELKLTSFGCGGRDGDCSNLFRNKDYTRLLGYFKYLSESLEINPLPVFNVYAFGEKLRGERCELRNNNLNDVRKTKLNDNIFSFAFVNMRTLSLTYIYEN